MMVELSLEEVSNWKRDPVTKKIFARLGFVIEDLKEMIVDGVQDVEFTRGFIQGVRMPMLIEGDEKDGNKEGS
jgi:hypothetical protein